MIKILFVCLGNICRSPMAEFICRDMLEKRGLSHKIACASAATSDEEAGNPVYPPARRKLKEMGIDCALKRAVQLTRGDYDRYDLLIGMEERNIAAMSRGWGVPSSRRWILFSGSPPQMCFMALTLRASMPTSRSYLS